MALVNTHYDVGPTWHGPRGEEKVLDYVALPTSVIGEIEACVALRRSARRLQQHHTEKLWDHVPVQVVVGRITSEKEDCPGVRLNREALSEALQKGTNRVRF